MKNIVVFVLTAFIFFISFLVIMLSLFCCKLDETNYCDNSQTIINYRPPDYSSDDDLLDF